MQIIVNARFLTQPITGLQRFAIEISKELKKAEPDIIFVAPQDILHTTIAEELGVVVFGKLKGILWEQISLPFYLKRHYPKAILLNLGNLAPILWKNQVNTILDIALFRNPSWFSLAKRLFYKFITPIILKRSRHILTISNFSKEEIQSYFNIKSTRISVIYCAVNPEYFSNFETLKTSTTTDYQNYILCVGSIEPRKNLINLIKAFLEFHQKNQEVKLVVVGKSFKSFNPKFLQDLNNALPHKNIIFTGYLSDEALSALYQNAIAFVYPSLYEGFGIPPLEAMAYGCPVITSDVASLPEVCGEAAYYVNPYDIESIVKGIEQVVKDTELRSELIKKGKERLAYFNWERSARFLLETIQKL